VNDNILIVLFPPFKTKIELVFEKIYLKLLYLDRPKMF